MKALSSERLGGLLLTLSFPVLVIGGVAAPSGAYQGPIEDRLAVIDANQAQWILSKVFDGTAVALLAAGGLTLAVGLHPRRLPGVTGGISLGLAGITGLIYVYRLATDPGPLYDRDTPVPMVVVLIALTAVGVLALSLHFLGAGYPRWSSLTGAVSGAGALVGLALILILRPGPEPAFAVELIAFLGILSIGVMLVRRHGRSNAAPASAGPAARASN